MIPLGIYTVQSPSIKVKGTHKNWITIAMVFQGFLDTNAAPAMFMTST